MDSFDLGLEITGQYSVWKKMMTTKSSTSLGWAIEAMFTTNHFTTNPKIFPFT